LSYQNYEHAIRGCEAAVKPKIMSNMCSAMAASPELELADPFIKMNSKRSHVSRLSHMNDIYGVQPSMDARWGWRRQR
jgi:hypothetical protein